MKHQGCDSDQCQVLSDNPCHHDDVFFDGIEMLGKICCGHGWYSFFLAGMYMFPD